MWLAVDCGNTCVKWALVKDFRRERIYTAPLNKIHTLRAAVQHVEEAWVSHVGDVQTARKLRAILASCKCRFVKSLPRAAGVVNDYRPPESLGVDRWLAMVAAAKLQRDVIIINTGTAATIDALRGDGVFLGGAILPGISLMKSALQTRVGLPAVDNKTVAFPPQNTRAAMQAGAVLAVVGAAQALRRRLLPGAKFILTGGDAAILLPHLPKSTNHLPNLPIDGIIRLRGLL
ncbi:MAG: type III pantothenate kinase [Gammaproteobacteria bacterium WSBS_2016_MAG_OTU1]